MPKPYTVVSGDTLTKIAQKFQKPSWKSIYYAPENADFRRKRPNPNLIYPGDTLLIPEPESAEPPIGGDIIPIGVTPDTGSDIRLETSGVWIVVSMNMRTVKMRLWKRNKGQIGKGGLGLPRFNTLMSEIRGKIGNGVIVQGGYQNNPSVSSPFEKFYFMGKVIIEHTWDKVTADDEEKRDRAFLSFYDDAGKSPSRRNFYFGNGVPGTDCEYGLGGLISIISARKASDRTSPTWVNAKSYGADCGRTFIGQRISDSLIAIGSQSDPSQKGPGGGTRYDIDTIQDFLMQQQFDDALFLDGSTSVLLDFDGARLIEPTLGKQTVNQTFLSFSTRAASGA